MAIAEQFAGLEMEKLIGAPLTAAADASIQLANSTADFINRVGFDGNGNVRTVAFGYQSRSVNEDGTSNLDEMKVDVPMLAIVPIPNLQVDEVNVLFDMEVKQAEKAESSLDVGLQLNASVGFGPVKVSVTGNVSVHQANTRSSDNSAKYHVDVRATNHGIPEGLARVLDMMAANVAPSLVGSTLKDENGQDLSGEAKTKAERLKKLRQEISQIESKLSAARGSLDGNISRLKKLATNQTNIYQAEMSKHYKPGDESDEGKKLFEELSSVQAEVLDTWNNFQNQALDLIKLVADTTKGAAALTTVSDVLSLKKFTATTQTDGTVTVKAEKYDGGDCYKSIIEAQNSAVEAQRTVDAAEEELLKKKNEYSSEMAK